MNSNITKLYLTQVLLKENTSSSIEHLEHVLPTANAATLRGAIRHIADNLSDSDILAIVRYIKDTSIPSKSTSTPTVTKSSGSYAGMNPHSARRTYDHQFAGDVGGSSANYRA